MFHFSLFIVAFQTIASLLVQSRIVVNEPGNLTETSCAKGKLLMFYEMSKSFVSSVVIHDQNRLMSSKNVVSLFFSCRAAPYQMPFLAERDCKSNNGVMYVSSWRTPPHHHPLHRADPLWLADPPTWLADPN